ncbi:hypothetical protein FisN_8Lh101 [Fistulifera solaris]|uniref:Uncharacterized protein n=1 Tax=Fistulifera solaris TaxID=1519565 RepID=A0A1Z5JDI6_FISSO|nr:hypothetical protein FisN_8Lh101 [Fistulifera solaris]|eukprot:GAX12006.1 hypothetical protein FisN_8Lh101 [Fistulifera solaris]
MLAIAVTFVILLSCAVVPVMAISDSSPSVTSEPDRIERSLLFRRLCGRHQGPTKLTAGKLAAFDIGKDQWLAYVLEGVPSGQNCVCETSCAFTPLNIDLYSNTDNDVTLDTAFAWDDSSTEGDSKESTTVTINNGSKFNCYAYILGKEEADGCFIKCSAQA